jgi:hypothetical protein
MTKRENIKMLEEMMRSRAFSLREATGRGWTREELSSDPTWSRLNYELTLLKTPKNVSTNAVFTYRTKDLEQTDRPGDFNDQFVYPSSSGNHA